MKKILTTLIVLCSLNPKRMVKNWKLKMKQLVCIRGSQAQDSLLSSTAGGLTVAKIQGLSPILSGILNTGPANMKEEDYKIEKFLKTSDRHKLFKKSSSIMVEAPPEKLESVLKLQKRIMENPDLMKRLLMKRKKALTNRAAMDDDMQAVISYSAQSVSLIIIRLLLMEQDR